MLVPMIIAMVYVAVNIVTFIAFGIDKRAAKQERWRISERTLFALALAGGGAGALFGRRFFRHKTRRLSFAVIPWIAIVIHLSAWTAWFLM